MPLEITVYSKDPCPGCVNVKNLLKQAKARYSEILAERDLTVEEMKAEVFEKTGHRLAGVPFITVDDLFFKSIQEFMIWYVPIRDQLESLTCPADIDISDFTL